MYWFKTILAKYYTQIGHPQNEYDDGDVIFWYHNGSNLVHERHSKITEHTNVFDSGGDDWIAQGRVTDNEGSCLFFTIDSKKQKKSLLIYSINFQELNL